LDDLDLKKMAARWVPPFLISIQQVDSEEYLAIINHGVNTFPLYSPDLAPKRLPDNNLQKNNKKTSKYIFL
jgi:hypothetical protein